MKLKKVFFLKIIFFLSLFCSANFNVFAETVILKTGKVVKGDVLDITVDNIQMSVNGKLVIYQLTDIRSINGKKFIAPPKIKSSISQFVEEIKSSKQTVEIKPKFKPKKSKKFFGPIKKTRISLDKEAPRRGVVLERGNLGQAKSYFQIGYIHYTLGETEEGAENYAKALKIEPELGEMYFQEGTTYHFLGSRIDARESILKAIALFEYSENFQQLDLAEDYLRRIY